MSTSEISLRNITPRDLEFVRKLRNNNRRQFFNTKAITKQEQQEWWKRNCANLHGFFIIFLGDKPIGVISEKWINNIEIDHSRRWVGLFEVGNLMLLREHQGKGYMTEALRLLTKRGGFFVAFVKPRNRASLKVFERGEFCRVT